MPPALQFLVLTFAGWVNGHQDDLIAYLREENRVLREHLGPRPLRRTDAQRRRLAVRGQQLGRRVLMQVAGIVTPDAILRWYRRLIAQTYDGSARRGRGRPMTRRDVAAFVVRMAVENLQWEDTRIRGALSNLGHEIARTTVKRILHDHGIDPAPERSRRMPWKTFLQAPWEGLTACDLFTVQALTRHVQRLPDGLMATLTWDRGLELAAHRTFSIATGVQVYFCDPYSPWQRGTNENTNGLLRQYLPKGTDLAPYTQAQLNRIARELNTRPRKTLGYRTPADILAETVALTG